MPTRNRSTTDSGRGELDEADLVTDAGNACILQFSHLATLRARKSGRSWETGLRNRRCRSSWAPHVLEASPPCWVRPWPMMMGVADASDGRAE